MRLPGYVVARVNYEKGSIPGIETRTRRPRGDTRGGGATRRVFPDGKDARPLRQARVVAATVVAPSPSRTLSNL